MRQALTRHSQRLTARTARGFTLLEVLIAVGLLGLALIGVAAVFPVGANWTRQTIEDNVAQNVALNAVDLIQLKYTFADFAGNTDTLVHAVPGQFAAGKLPVSDRTYALNQSPPYPAPNVGQADYYWTALYRQATVGSHDVTIYILVFRKGEATQNFPVAGDLPGSRDTTEVPPGTGFPNTVTATYNTGALAGNVITGAVPDIGSYGIVATSGAVFKQGLNANGTAGDPHVTIPGGVGNIIYCPPPTNWPQSPLVYVYQTTISF